MVQSIITLINDNYLQLLNLRTTYIAFYNIMDYIIVNKLDSICVLIVQKIKHRTHLRYITVKNILTDNEHKYLNRSYNCTRI